jgi:mRNA interferase RelE/StbE
MTYKLKFIPSSWKEWKKLDATIQTQLQKKLNERLENPHVSTDKLRGFMAVYKIKLRASGYRLIYEVEDEKITVLVIAIGKRNRSDVYQKALKRLQ